MGVVILIEITKRGSESHAIDDEINVPITVRLDIHDFEIRPFYNTSFASLVFC